MENLANYSQYVAAAYLVASVAISALALFVIVKYCRVKKIISHEK